MSTDITKSAQVLYEFGVINSRDERKWNVPYKNYEQTNINFDNELINYENTKPLEYKPDAGSFHCDKDSIIQILCCFCIPFHWLAFCYISCCEQCNNLCHACFIRCEENNQKNSVCWKCCKKKNCKHHDVIPE